MNRVLGQARAAMVARHLAAGDGADNAVDVDDPVPETIAE
jgi:hypothetical protein